MLTLKNLHHQVKARRDGKPAFTLLELIVVLLVLGILAAIAVPTFNRVKENSVVRAAQTTLEAAARNGEAIAKSDGDATDEQIADAVESEFADANGLSVTVSGNTVTVSQTNGSFTASGSVEFNNGVGTIVGAAVSGGGGAPAYTYALTAADFGGYGSCNTVFPSTPTVATFYCMGGATANGLAALSSLAPGDTIEISWCDPAIPGSDCNNNGAGPVVSETLTYTIASVSTGGSEWSFTTVEAMPPVFGAGSRGLVGMWV
jgi:type IV pilus assembly protein PilA